MNENIRIFGWLLLGMGFVLTLLGVMAIIGLVHVQIDAFGVNLDTIQERIAWVVLWVVAAVTGGLLLGLTNPEDQEKSV